MGSGGCLALAFALALALALARTSLTAPASSRVTGTVDDALLACRKMTMRKMLPRNEFRFHLNVEIHHHGQKLLCSFLCADHHAKTEGINA